MKKVVLCFSIISAIFFAACQKDTQQEEVNLSSVAQRAEWLNSDLDSRFSQSQQLTTCYLFKPEDLSELVSTLNLYEVRFVLGYANDAIRINAVGVDALGNELKIVSSSVLFDGSFTQKLEQLNSLPDKENIGDGVVSQHLLLPKKAFHYIQDWHQKLVQGVELDEVTSYNGLRIHHFSLEKEVVLDMAIMNRAAKIALFLGLNDKGKMTTVFMGLDSQNNLILPSPEARDEDLTGKIYDFTRPCPPAHDFSDPLN
jgi:hypothetical protein